MDAGLPHRFNTNGQAAAPQPGPTTVSLILSSVSSCFYKAGGVSVPSRFRNASAASRTAQDESMYSCISSRDWCCGEHVHVMCKAIHSSENAVLT
jgi:hypothetical protein